VRLQVKGGFTEIYSSAAWSFFTLRATIMTLAPLWARSLPRPLPMPVEPPVRRTVCDNKLAELGEIGVVNYSTYPPIHREMVLSREETHDVKREYCKKHKQSN